MIINGVICSLLDEQIIRNCKSCPLMKICDEIDEEVRKFAKGTTTFNKIS